MRKCIFCETEMMEKEGEVVELFGHELKVAVCPECGYEENYSEEELPSLV